MRLGLFMMPLHPPGPPMHVHIEEDTRKSLLAEELGFDELWLGEHFSAISEPYPSPLMFMANLLPQTKRIKFATGVINLPNRHPAIVAGEIAQFDHLSKGRLIFGAGTGSLGSDFELFQVGDAATRQRMLVESLDTIQKIWSSKPPYDIKGEFWTTRIEKAVSAELGLGEMPKPYQLPHPEICVPSASPHSQTVRLAGQRGWSFVTSGLLQKELVGTHWDQYVRGCEEVGRIPDGERWRLSRSVFVAPTDEEARRRIMDPRSAYQHFLGYMRTIFKNLGKLHALKSRPEMADKDITVNGIIEDRVIFGSPRTVARQILELREQCGPFGTLLIIGADWSGINAEWESESMRLLATEVMPLIKSAERRSQRADAAE